MKLDQNLITVLEMMMNRIESSDMPGAGFGIPEPIASPDTVTEDEAKALEAAGFVWRDDMHEDMGSYWLSLKEPVDG